MAGIRVHRIRELADGSIDVAFHGGEADSRYIRSLLDKDKGATVSEPQEAPGTAGVFVHLIVSGTPANPVSKDRVVRRLSEDDEIVLVPGADVPEPE
jgi:hypothetical protein